MLVGLGLRHRSALSPFVLYGRSLVASFAEALAPPSLALAPPVLAPAGLALALGVLAHGFWLLVWGICFTFVAAPLRARPLAISSALGGALFALGATRFLPSTVGAVTRTSLSVSQSLLLAFVLALALFLGTRLARD